MAAPLWRQRPHGSHQHGSAACPLCCGQRGFPFPATPLGTLPQVTASAAAGGQDQLHARGSAPAGTLVGSRVPAAAPSLFPAARHGASAGDRCRSHPPPQLQGHCGRVIRLGATCTFFMVWRGRARRRAASTGRNIAAGRRVGRLGSWRGAITQPPLSARCYVNGLGCPPRPDRSPRRTQHSRLPRAVGIAGHGCLTQPALPQQRPGFASRGWSPGMWHGSPPGMRCRASPPGLQPAIRRPLILISRCGQRLLEITRSLGLCGAPGMCCHPTPCPQGSRAVDARGRAAAQRPGGSRGSEVKWGSALHCPRVP